MRKQVLFTTVLSLAITGGMTAFVTPVMASVTQTKTVKVKGVVVDENNEPLIGATVAVKGTKSGAITDLDGNFVIDAPADAVLTVSYVGYQTREFAVKGREDLGQLKMNSDQTMLEQVVVVGYGTQKKADLTGSVAVVNADELKRVSHSNISSMLEGKVAGVQITSDGQPGADPAVRIRGIGSFNNTNPLYVIDGVPVGTSIRDFSPNDIETIQVLKDASAGAIYGSRAANGVVIITTKSGKKDQPLKLHYTGYFGIDKAPSGVYDLMNADQYSDYLGVAAKNSGTTLPGGYKLGADGHYHFQDATNTDWFNEVFKTGIRHNHNVSMSGGGANNTYNVSLDYFKQKGIIKGAGPSYERFTTRVNNTFDTKFIKFRTSLVYVHSDQDGMGISNANEYTQGLYGMDGYNVLSGTVLMQPTIKAYDQSTWFLDNQLSAASSYHYDAYGYGVYSDTVHGDISASNPLLVNNLLTRNTKVDRFLGTGSAEVDIFKMIGHEMKNHKLNYKLNLSYGTTRVKNKTWTAAWIQSNRVYLDKTQERLTRNTTNYTDALIENTLTYDGMIGLHHINAVVGQTYQVETSDNINGWAVNFPEPYYLQLQNGEKTYSSSGETKHTMTSFLGRLNYDYDGKYLLSFVIRRDGSSRLSKDIRWGTFPSISVGWRFDKESFYPIPHNIINMFKLRASYGVLGNEEIGEYMYMTTMARRNMTYSFGNTVSMGSAVSTFVNKDIAWEKRKTANIGLDLAFLNNRIEFTAEWYKNTSKDLLYAVPVPSNAGVANETVMMNAATMTNSGFEFSATYRNNDHPLKWQISANLSTLRNRVTELGFGKEESINGIAITRVGEEVGQHYGWVYERIARTQADLDDHAKQPGAQVGDCLYKDVNEDGVIDEKDQTVLGSGLAKVNFGLSFRLEYKNFDLSVATYGTFKHDVADDLYNRLNSPYGWANKDIAIGNANQWSEDGLTYLSNVPRTYITHPGVTLGWNDLFSDRKIQNAAYWKIANVEFGYNFPDKWFRGIVTGVRAYVSAQNLHTFTAYKGYNVDYAGGTFTPGFNYCSFPTPRTFMFGLHFSF